MTTLSVLMHLVTGIFTIVFPCKIIVDWVTLYDRCSDGSGNLGPLGAAANRWIVRHLACAFIAIFLIIAMTHHPDLQGDDPLPKVTAIYAVFTLICAFAESLLAQSIACLSRK